MKYFLTLILLFTFSLNTYANEQGAIPAPYLGLGSSLLIGFGTGPAIQDRELSRTLTYAGTQGLGLILLFAGAGSCNGDCSSSRKAMRTAGASLFLGSKLIEVIDSSLFAWKYYESENVNSKVLFLPVNNGGSVATVINF